MLITLVSMVEIITEGFLGHAEVDVVHQGVVGLEVDAAEAVVAAAAADE